MHQDPSKTAGEANADYAALRRRWVLLASAHGFVLATGLVYFKTAKVIDVAMQVRLHWSVGPRAYAQELAVAMVWLTGLLLAGVVFRHRKWPGRVVFGLASVAEISAFFYGMFNVHYYRLFGIPLNLEAMSDVEKVGDFWTTVLPYLTSWHTLVAALLSVVVLALPLWIRVGRLERWFSKLGRGLTKGWRAPVAGGAAFATIVFVPIDQYELAHNDVVEMTSSALRLWLEDEKPNREFEGETNRPVISYAEPTAMIEPTPDLLKLKRRVRRAHDREPMNVVFIVLESMVSPDVAEQLGIDEAMPYINKLKERSLVFEDYSTVFPLSMKSLVTLTCSLLPSPERMTLTKINPRLDCRSVSEVAKEHGYRAGLFHSGYYSFTMKDLFFADRGYDVMMDAEDFHERNPSWNTDAWGIQEEGAVESMFEWIDENPDQPFLAVYVPVVGHYPYVPLRRKFRGKFGTETKVENYKNAIAYADSTVRRVVRGLKKRKLRNDTIFVIVGDHGLPLELHPNNDVQSAAIFEENVRTLGFIYQPKLIKETIEYPEIVQHPDILPSLYDLLGWDIPDRYAGVSIFAPYRKKMAIHYTLRSKKLAALRDGDLKVILDLRKKEATTYDLEADPGETEDVSEEHAELVEHVKEFFDAFLPTHTSFIQDYPVIQTQTELPDELAQRIAQAPQAQLGRDEALARASTLMQADDFAAYQEAETLILSQLAQNEADFDALSLLVRIYDRQAVLHDPARYERARNSVDDRKDDAYAELAYPLMAVVKARFPERRAELDGMLLWMGLTGQNSKAEDRANRYVATRLERPDDPEVISLGAQLIRDSRARRLVEKSDVSLEDAFERLEAYVAEHPEDWFVGRQLFDLYWRELRDFEAARSLCDADRALASDNLTLVLDVGEAYYSVGAFTEATALFDRAADLALADDFELAIALIRSRRGGIAFLVGDYSRAEQEFLAMLEYEGRHPMALGGLALVSLRRGDVTAAEGYAKMALSHNSRKIWAWNADGEVKSFKQQPSRKSFAKGSSWKLLSADSYFHAGLQSGRAAMAERNLATALRDFDYDARRFEHYVEMVEALVELNPKAELSADMDALRRYSADRYVHQATWRRASKAEARGLRRRAERIASDYLEEYPRGMKRGSMQSIIRRVQDRQEGLDEELREEEEAEADDDEDEEDTAQ